MQARGRGSMQLTKTSHKELYECIRTDHVVSSQKCIIWDCSVYPQSLLRNATFMPPVWGIIARNPRHRWDSRPARSMTAVKSIAEFKFPGSKAAESRSSGRPTIQHCNGTERLNDCPPFSHDTSCPLPLSCKCVGRRDCAESCRGKYQAPGYS